MRRGLARSFVPHAYVRAYMRSCTCPFVVSLAEGLRILLATPLALDKSLFHPSLFPLPPSSLPAF